ncbi:MAG: zinc ribbon domain-containing protein [Chlorobiales bacterium]|nr:zinc ribbon domain-containing protein [Chlorobiales bacterium]
MVSQEIKLTKKCKVCDSEIGIDAKKCPFCQSFQNRAHRRVKNFFSNLSSFTVLITAITLSASFFPNAYRNVFYEDKIEIHSVKNKISGVKGLITFENRGDGDVFINEVSFMPKDTVRFLIKDRNVIVNKWVKRGEVMSLPYRSFQKANNYDLWPYINPSQYDKYKRKIDQHTYEKIAKHYFRLEVFDKEYGDRGVNPLFGNIDVVATVKFNSFRSDGLVKHISSKELWGQIRCDEKKINTIIMHEQ